MIGFKTTLLKFGSQGEKTGWTYILIPGTIAEKIQPGTKKSFRVKGKIDDHKIKSVALLPMGEGNFIMPVNAAMRKAIRKTTGATVTVELQKDTAPLKLSAELMACLAEEPEARAYFDSLPKSHQQYFSKWIESAKTEVTKTKRIAACVTAFLNKLNYAQMLQLHRKES
jgi:hypothetical protein